ncbi:protein kinase [Lentzea sp. NPDC051213]|uniref:serine/threonine-protein kinase n=1 Tax=Lentzea sp. NPDC051213 TaxID=3364126 RepID=UPI0037A29AEE
MNKLGDRYVLLDQIGAGAMGIVWRARDELLHRDVAVKQMLLNDVQPHEAHEAVQRAMREGRIAARLQHANAIAVYDVVVDNGKPCLVMEYLPSKNLSAILDERGPMPPVEAARVGSLAANALAAAHEAGIVHRDIKPGNVLIGRDGAVKITDFGISRALGDVAVTKTGMLAGTPAYLAPELARGSEPGPAADVFSLGATIYAMTEGEPPFGRSTNDLGLLYKVARGETRPPMRSGPLTPLLTRLLANEPAHRPTAAQAAEELKAIASGRPVPPTTVLPPSGTPPHGTAVMGSGPGTYPPAGPRTMQQSGPPSMPPQAPRTRPPAPLPEPEPEQKKNRTLAVVASILAVLLIAGVAYAIVNSQKDSGGQAAGPSSSAKNTQQTQVPPASAGETSQNTPSPKPTAQTKPSQPPSSAPAGGGSKFTPAQVTQFVTQHYAKLPSDPDGSLEDWNPDDAPTSYTTKTYWGDFTKVAIKGRPLVQPSGDGNFTVTVTLELTKAETNKTTTEEHKLEISGKGDKLLITGEERP